MFPMEIFHLGKLSVLLIYKPAHESSFGAVHLLEFRGVAFCAGYPLNFLSTCLQLSIHVISWEHAMNHTLKGQEFV